MPDAFAPLRNYYAENSRIIDQELPDIDSKIDLIGRIAEVTRSSSELKNLDPTMISAMLKTLAVYLAKDILDTVE